MTSTSAALPSPPFVAVAGIANFRDIGGQPSSSGGRNVRRGLVFRSADPSKATEDGLKKMSGELGLKVVFDLRSVPEIKRDGPEWAGVQVASPDVFASHGIRRDWVPVFAEQDYGPEQVALRYKEYTRSGSEGFVRAYHDILLAASGREGAYTKIMRHLAAPAPEPCLVHCTAGKDRTGVLVALLYLLAGVSADRIADEYSLTDQGLAELRPLFIERLLKNPALGSDREGVQNMVSSKRENMLATLKMIESDFGGAEAYVKDRCGLSGEEVEKVRKNLEEVGGS